MNKNKESLNRRISKPLTELEKQIMHLICDQFKTTEIAGIIGKSVRTTETDRLVIMRKIGVENSIGIAIYAIKHGIYEP
jgi:DNA-binding NarL/FixJ family response regulator